VFTKILIANRGEIACRVAATARRMGIQTVAVYSEADAHARHVAECDEARAIGPAAAQDSYLRIERIVAAARDAGAQAVHPGYGFLSENPAFAEACAQAGLIFIGPPAAAMRAMGSKSAAKALMEQAGVPLVPGYHGDNQEPEFLRAQAAAIGYPVLIKASAGGGGKGMRIVGRDEDFPAALESCRREAANSFGDGQLLLEKYLQRARHIEIQVFADMHGNAVHLFERDCSVQRRHQKVLEEAPAPGMTAAWRQAMGEAALAAAKAVGYVGAGTVEFIVDASENAANGAFYFMEMNTRLQVEHPVTELITGADLVEWQLRVAVGEPLPKTQEALQIRGHAIEARVYAENPDKDFLPSTGMLRHLRTPAALQFSLPQTGSSTTEAYGGASALTRIDSGVREGDAITAFYDPMIAKLIVWGKNREHARQRMAQALAEYEAVGPATNIAFLLRLIASTDYASARLDTGLIERQREELLGPQPPASMPALALAAAALLQAEREQADHSDPWSGRNGWRLNGMLRRPLRFADEAGDYRLTLVYRPDGWQLETGDISLTLHITQVHECELSVQLGEEVVRGTVVRDGEDFHIFHAGLHAVLVYADPLAHAGDAQADAGSLTAPMPGKIVAALVKPGDAVKKGAPLLIMEAMKMEHVIAAPDDGIIETMRYAVGDQVAEGTQLLSLLAPPA